jgi:photosystem II stability/assembly factor-like uncharacterized protein
MVLVAMAAAHGRTAVGAASWVNVTGNLAYQASECGNLSIVSAKPGSDMVIAGIALRGLWVNRGGATWTPLGTGAGSDIITNRPTWITYDPANPAVFWQSGSYNGGGVYKTTDGGTTFRRLGSVVHNDYVSVDLSDPNRQILLAGAHEAPQEVYKSTDGGQSWKNVGTNLPANTKFSSNPLVINATTYLVNASGWGAGATGIFRTTDGGGYWQMVSAAGPSGGPLVSTQGMIYWADGGNLLKSTDSGATWVQLVGAKLNGITPVELPDGRLASAAGDRLVLSSDGGLSWTPTGAPLPYQPGGLTYSASQAAFFIWRVPDCNDVVAADAVMRLDFVV